ncbi:transcriptional regulatory protein YycF [bacterium BMS3Bbin05]|nr:transcriptional regulatory protein YycF [bacterium BMS3Bbin05]
MAKKLLLADDSITIQKVVELVLSDEDFQIKTVGNGMDAKDQMEIFKPDIVLADIEMPELNGYQLCEQIKKNSATAHIPVMLLAGAFEPLDEELAKSVGADDFIIKPFESQELISKINAIMTSAGIEEEAVEVGVGDEDSDIQGEASVVSEEVPEEAEPVEALAASEAVDEDLWVMDDTGPGGDESDIWKLDEETAIASGADELKTAEESVVEAESAVSPEIPTGESTYEIPGAEEPLPEKPFEAKEVRETPEAPGEVASVPVEEPLAVSMPEIKAPSKEEISNMIRESVDNRIGLAVEKINIENILSGTLSPVLGDSLEKMINEQVPGLLQKSLDSIMQDSLSSINSRIEKIIWETVPDLAENLIRKEIEKIKSEI